MKNVYAIMAGHRDGLEEKTGKPHHNLKAATFNEAVREMSILFDGAGGLTLPRPTDCRASAIWR